MILSESRNFRGLRFGSGCVESVPFSNPDFRQCLAMMADRGLVLDVGGPEQPPYDFVGVLSCVEDLARSFPSLNIVVNHCGGLVGPTAFPPGKSGTEALEGWKRLVGDLGR